MEGNGSQSNVEDLTAGDVQLGFVQSDVMSYAYNGERLFDSPVTNFSVVAALYMEQVQIVTLNPDIKTVADLAGKSVWLKVRTQIEEWDDGKNPQFLLFINGRETQGLDMNHREVQLFPKAPAGEKLQLDIQAYTGTLHTEFQFLVELYEQDEEINRLYWDIQVPLRAFSRMKEDGQERLAIQTALNETINLLDLREPYSEGFYASLRAAQAYVTENLYEKLGGWDDIVATCIGHTHIDVAWWWTVAQTREKVARSFATVLKLMEEFPSYRFMSSQPVLYYFLKERYPALYERIKERVKEGRWEPEGGMWLEADCNLTSGESLVRQFVHGKRFFKMAPLHHHFELCGWKENKVVAVFAAVSAIFCALALLGVWQRYHI